MFTFLIIYFFNLILDYPLQGQFLAEYKQKNNYVLFVHCAIWGIGLSIILAMFGLFAWWKLIMLVAGHYIIDYWKCRRLYKKWPTNTIEGVKVPIISDEESLYIDQFLHVVQLILCLL